MNLPTNFISCDWGTTNFRLRVVATTDLSILAEHQTETGIRVLNDTFLKQSEVGRQDFYAAYLRSQLEALPPEHHRHPVMVSGMASANIGLRELPYGDLPLLDDGKGIVFADLKLWPKQQIRLISGIRSTNGMMRGEETQALGLLKFMSSGSGGVLLLPGTHSKHLTFRNGGFTDFTSYLTGELFEILTRHSILASSVAAGEWNTQAGESFRQGVSSGFQDGLSPHLFSIRAGQILRQTDVTDNFYRLSGILLGDELSHLPRDQAQHIYLAGSGPLLRLYRFALEITGHAERLTVYDDQVLGQALLTGQRQILRRQN